MMQEERRLRAEIVEVGRRLYARGLIVAGEGNISARVGEERLLVTPSGVCKGYLQPEDLVLTDLAGRPLRAGQRVSTETAMHVACYRHRPDIRAVVHAHAPTVTAFSVAGRRLEPHVLPEVVVTLGTVPTLPYTDPGSCEVPDAVGPAIETCEALILAFHGVVTVGESPLAAFYKMETVEHTAQIQLLAHQLGGIRTLDESAVAKLLETRRRAGLTIGRPDRMVREAPGESQAALIEQVTAAVLRQLQGASPLP